MPRTRLWDRVYCLRTADKAPDKNIGGFSFLLVFQVKKGADERTRTADLLITSELLYLLSYVGLFRAQSIS